MKPAVLRFIPCEDAVADPSSLQKVNIFGVTSKIRSGQRPPFPFQLAMLKVLIFFRGGKGAGKFFIRVTHENSGRIVTQSRHPHRVQFVGDPHEVCAIIVKVRNCVFHSEGVYWIELVFDDEVIARQPIRIHP